jgi:hypothetical protein
MRRWQCKELQDTQIAKTVQQNAALTLLDGAPLAGKKHAGRGPRPGELIHSRHKGTLARDASPMQRPPSPCSACWGLQMVAACRRGWVLLLSAAPRVTRCSHHSRGAQVQWNFQYKEAVTLSTPCQDAAVTVP